MNKKAIAILGAIFLLIIGTLGFLIYSKYSSKTPTPAPVAVQQQATTTPAATNTASTTPPAPASNVVMLTQTQVVSPALSFDGQSIAYLDTQGDLLQASLGTDSSGQLQFTSTKNWNIPPKANVTKVLWPSSANKTDMLVQTVDATGATRWSYFNGGTGTYTDLPAQIESVDWMPSGSQIAYIWVQNGKATLSIANPDATNYHNITEMWQLDDEIHVSPDGSQILYYETNNPSAASAGNSINSVSIDGKVFKGLVKAGQNFGVLWSPDGQKFLFGKKDVVTQDYQLWYYNLTSGEVENLGLFTTVDKAVWAPDSETIYAAVPNSAAASPGSLTNDSFFKMDTTTLNKQQFSTGTSTVIDGENLFLSTDGGKLFFKNAQDGGLYYLNLNQ